MSRALTCQLLAFKASAHARSKKVVAFMRNQPRRFRGSGPPFHKGTSVPRVQVLVGWYVSEVPASQPSHNLTHTRSNNGDRPGKSASKNLTHPVAIRPPGPAVISVVDAIASAVRMMIDGRWVGGACTGSPPPSRLSLTPTSRATHPVARGTLDRTV